MTALKTLLPEHVQLKYCRGLFPKKDIPKYKSERQQQPFTAYSHIFLVSSLPIF